MAKISTLSMLNKVERAATVDLGDLKADLAGIEVRIDELNSQLGTLAADLKIKQWDYKRTNTFGDKARAKGILATIETWEERRAVLVEEREQLVHRAEAIRRRMSDQVIAAQRAQAAGADDELRPAVKKLLAAFDAFCEADDEYRQLKTSFVRQLNHWPLSLIALTPWQRKQFRVQLENFLKGSKNG